MTQPGGSGQQSGQQAPGSRPGQMTAVMRAVAVASGPKVLRIGLVQGGKVIEERVIKQRTHVTVGPSEKNTFVVVASVPPSFKLFELVGSDYFLNFLDGMTGRIALQTGPTDLAALRGSAKKNQQGAYQVRLTEDSRGKVVVGETTFLFQFVAPPPIQPKPQLPASVKSGLGDQVDWGLTIIAAFSFLLHFGAIGSFYSDWADKVVDDEASIGGLVERINKLPPPPPPEQPKVDEAATATAAAAAKEAPKAAGGTAGKAAGAPGKGAPVSKEQGAALLAKLDQMDVATISTLTSGGTATGNVLKDGQVPTGQLDQFAQSGAGVGASGPGGLKMGGPGGGPVVPGQGGGGLASVGGGNGAQGTTGSSGGQQKVEGPKASVSGGGSVSVGKISGADRVLAGARGRVRGCYQSGLGTNPDMEGRVSFTISVGGSGSVSSVNVSPGGTISGAVVSCINGVLRGLNFDPPDGGAATVAGSFSFVNSNKGK